MDVARKASLKGFELGANSVSQDGEEEKETALLLGVFAAATEHPAEKYRYYASICQCDPKPPSPPTIHQGTRGG